jgi:hypothetical protein
MSISRRRRGTALLAAMAGLLTAGCTALAGPARIDPPAPAAGPAFPGLLPSAQNRASRRYVFQIHGINTADPEWGESLLARISPRGYVRTRTVGPIDGYWRPATLATVKTIRSPGLTCEGNPTCTFSRFGIYKKDVFSNATTGDRVTVFTYFWRGDLWRITGPYLKYDIAANDLKGWTPNSHHSAINAAIKAGLVDNGLSDAAGYISGLGQLEREGLETAICAMLADAIDTEAARSVAPGTGCLARLAPLNNLDPSSVEFNFLSHSLGSRMLYDVLSGEEAATHRSRSDAAVSARAFIATRTRTMFMAANQMPLLAVAGLTIEDAPAGGAPEATELPVKSFLSLHAQPRSGATQEGYRLPAPPPVPSQDLTVIAFQDPDDLLGFKASDAVLGENVEGVRFVDVVHRNTPQIAFILAWPLSAHDNELNEPNSLKMILCGATADAIGGLKADRCLTGNRH